jgi:POT family proton-dependent oligopeptide transporter
MASTAKPEKPVVEPKGIAGHPPGLSTLFFTELWERFSYYGMRALLILFMVAPVAKGGLGFDTKKAAAIYGLYTSMVYMTSLPGGWVADQFLGQRRAVLIGGIVIALGHFSMAFTALPFFYVGLVLIVLGTGLLKPNISSMVGSLYAEGDPRRDSGFSIFYMGINLGAMLSPLVCGYLGQKINWHLGFAAAGVGMTFGLIQYVAGGRRLGNAGLRATPPATRKFLLVVLCGLFVGGLVYYSRLLRFLLLGLLAVYALYYYFKKFTLIEKKRMAVIVILFVFATLFWAAFEQAGSSLNLFADRYTRNAILGWQFPSSWFQSVNAVFIILLAPVFAWLWLRLGPREPSSPAKFAYGLFFVGLGFLIVAAASSLSGPEQARVSPLWLIAVYLCHTIGELCLSPVGLSTVTKLAPVRVVGLMMGVWFLSISLGNYIGGWVAGFFGSFPLPKLFGAVALTTVGPAVLLALLVRPIRNLMGGVH